MAGIRWHLLHPAVVHFPLALLILGGAARLVFTARRAPAWLEEATTWLLWLGTLSAWITLGLGQLAEEHAPHVPMAWQALNAHETLAWWTAGWFTVLSAAVFFLRRAPRPWPNGGYGILALWLLGLGLLGRTAYFGGELVFKHGMGVGDAEAELSAP